MTDRTQELKAAIQRAESERLLARITEARRDEELENIDAILESEKGDKND